jgi:nucleotide-binding universal stress UspA family protein
MSQTLIVPLDRSKVSEQVLPLARMLAKITGGAVILVSVIDLPFEFNAWIDGSTLLNERIERGREELTIYLDGIAKTFSDAGAGRSVEPIIKVGSNPAAEILELVSEYDDPLIVMASHGRSGVRLLVPGSVTNPIVLGSSSPVLVVRAVAEDEAQPDIASLDTMLVPLDGSMFAEAALAVAQQMASYFPLNYHLLRVIESIEDPALDYFEPNHYDEYREAAFSEAQSYLEQVAERLTSEGAAVTWEISEGPPAVQIDQCASEQRADLIVMSTHGRSGIRGLILGSVAERVLHGTTVPLLLVRPKDVQ